MHTREADAFFHCEVTRGWSGYLEVKNIVVLTLAQWLPFNLMLPQPETPQLPACFSSSGWAAHGTTSENSAPAGTSQVAAT